MSDENAEARRACECLPISRNDVLPYREVGMSPTCFKEFSFNEAQAGVR